MKGSVVYLSIVTIPLNQGMVIAMTQYDLAGNPLPNNGASPPQYDLAGNPIESQSAAPAGGAYAPPGTAGQTVQYDLAGNPLPAQQAPPSYGAPGGRPQTPGQQAYGSSRPQQSRPYGGPPTDAVKQGNNRALGIGIGVVVAAAILGGVVYKMMVPSPVPAPTAYQTFTAPNKDFQIAGPTGWAVITAPDVGDSSSDSGVGGVLFKSGSAFIDVSTHPTREIRDQILLNEAGMAPDALSGSQAAYEQKHTKSLVGSILKNYQEKPMPPFASLMGESAVSEYTADGPKIGFGPKVHGYRITTVGPKVYALINCQCAEADWQTLKPAFVRVINTIADGNAPAPR